MVKKGTSKRMNRLVRELNVGLETLVEFLGTKGIKVEPDPNAKLSPEACELLMAEYKPEAPAESKHSHEPTPAPEPPQTIGDALGTSAVEQADEHKAEVVLPPAEQEPELKSLTKVPKKDEEERDKVAPSAAKVPEPVSRTPKRSRAATVKRKQNSKKAIEQAAPANSLFAAPASETAVPDTEKPTEVAATRQESASKEDQVHQEQTTGAAKQPESPATATAEHPVASPQGEESQGKAEPQSSTKAPEQEAKVVAAGPATTITEPKVASVEKKAEEPFRLESPKLAGPKVVGKVDLEAPRARRSKASRSVVDGKRPESPAAEPKANAQPTPATQPIAAPAEEKKEEKKEEVFRIGVEKPKGLTVLGKLDLSTVPDRRRKPEASATPGGGVSKRRHHRRPVAVGGPGATPGSAPARPPRPEAPERRRRTTHQPERQEITAEDVEEKIRQTKARMASHRTGSAKRGVQYRREKREAQEQRREQAKELVAAESKTLNVSEFISVSELASLMDVEVTDVITTCMNVGLMVTINQRLDAETMKLVAEEYGFTLKFVESEIATEFEQQEDKPEDLEPRQPVITVMGHANHGKTSLCDAIRKTNVIAGEAGGITQHLSAYAITLANGRKFTLIDTPGHAAFTAMRARGAQLTDIVIVVIAADDGVQPQTLEAITHASATGARLVFAINKIDSPSANVERVKQQLSEQNYLVEDWGGKYQSQEISAKHGKNIDALLEKVLLEADVMDLKANPNRNAEGVVLEAALDRGRGYVAMVLVQNGTLRKGDSIVSGSHHGRVKALFNDQGAEVKEASVSIPVKVVGLNGAPQAGDTFQVVESDKVAKEIAAKVSSIRRVQDLRTRKHITLDEIGRRIAIGHFQELNLIVKADVDGSLQALSGALVELSTPEIQVNVISGGVGQITESDVTMAATTNSIIVGFQVRPSVAARRQAENEQIDIRLYSVIFDAIDEIRSAMEGMLSPEIREEVVGTLEVQQIYNISKVGRIAGCIVQEGKVQRTNKVHIIRDGIVVYTSELSSLKRFKDEAKEVTLGQECGLSIKNYNDVKVGDMLEVYNEIEVRRTL